jgi:hypothetical protein
MRKFAIYCFIATFFINSVYAADKAIVYDDTNKKIKTSQPLPVAQGGTGSATQNFVGLTGDQSIAGAKTFTSIPVLPASDPTTDNQAARKAYVDTKPVINTLTEKTALVDNDLFIIEDSEASNAKKKVKKSNVSSIRNQLFTSSGIFTAPAGITKVYLSGCAGGGGGGGASSLGSGGGGASGMSVIKYPYTVIPTSEYTVTINGGGAGGVNDSSGSTGGTTVFGTLTLLGGNGGDYGSSAAGGSAFTPNGINAVGGTGGIGGKDCVASGAGGNGSGTAGGGGGGGNPFGIGGAGGNSSTAGSNGTGYGSGGGGAGGGTNYRNGGNGQAGFILVEW